MIACPLCLQKPASYRPSKWDPYYRCNCGALFQIRFRLAMPHFPTLGLRRCEPLRLPSPGRYYAYFMGLKTLFQQLRGGCSDEIRRRASAFTPLCDLIRFGDEHAALTSSAEDKDLLKGFEKESLEQHFGVSATWWQEGKKWWVLGDFEQFHTQCDFAGWCLERIGDGRFSERDAQSFGYTFQHFPYVACYPTESAEIAAAYRRATQGLLPTSRRAQVRSRMNW